VGLSTAIRQELAQNDIEHIYVCVVMPTAHDTPFFDHAANHTGHEVQPPAPLHDPQEVVDAIVDLARDPENTKVVGSDGLFKIVMKKLAPAAADKAMGKTMQRIQMEKRRPAKIRAAPSSSPCAKEPAFQRDVSMVDLRCSGGLEN